MKRNEHSFRAIMEVALDNKRDRILRETLNLITENGFHGTPISQIAKAADVGAGTIYRYFTNKEMLINELFTSIKKEIIQAMLENYSTEFSPFDQFKILWKNMVYYFASHSCQFHFIEQYRYAPYMSNMTRAESFRILQPVMQFFIRSKRNKDIKDLPLYTIIALVYGPIISITKLHHDHKMPLTEERINQAVQGCWDAIKLQQE